LIIQVYTKLSPLQTGMGLDETGSDSASHPFLNCLLLKW